MSEFLIKLFFPWLYKKGKTIKNVVKIMKDKIKGSDDDLC